ncbi:hypothetical protein CCUS01_11255 [Colletotrichum cuscutae]|uniref:Uncharacterized protein n=1 Tax=Colletotrichum cuscutae TaxID=1209917 RepID=A0AAI9XK89_9PEZI|nr:hypothetical protein CCUS01_11255 [Colletotrichum cuscutae]
MWVKSKKMNPREGLHLLQLSDLFPHRYISRTLSISNNRGWVIQNRLSNLLRTPAGDDIEAKFFWANKILNVRAKERNVVRLALPTAWRPNARPDVMDLEPDSTSGERRGPTITKSTKPIHKSPTNSGRRTTTTRAATLAKERAKPIKDDDIGLLLTTGKQIKELHAAIKIMFEAWKKSETWNKNVEAELRVVTSALQTVESELQSVKGELQAMRERVGDESAKTNENLEAILLVAATRNSPSVSYSDVARSGLGEQGRDSQVATLGNATLPSRSDPLQRSAQRRSDPGYGSWRCRAITVNPRNTDRTRITCRDDAEHKLVKQMAEKSFDELYPMKVDNLKRTEVLDEKGNVGAEAAKARSLENETTVTKISWPSEKDMPKAYGSMTDLRRTGRLAQRITEGWYSEILGKGFSGGSENIIWAWTLPLGYRVVSIGRNIAYERRYRTVKPIRTANSNVLVINIYLNATQINHSFVTELCIHIPTHKPGRSMHSDTNEMIPLDLGQSSKTSYGAVTDIKEILERNDLLRFDEIVLIPCFQNFSGPVCPGSELIFGNRKIDCTGFSFAIGVSKIWSPSGSRSNKHGKTDLPQRTAAFSHSVQIAVSRGWVVTMLR